MDVHTERLEVTCPGCGEEFAAWFDRPATGTTGPICPRCGRDLSADPWFRDSSVWSAVEDDERYDRT